MKFSATTLAALASAGQAVAGPIEASELRERAPEFYTSPPFYPTPWMNPQAVGWEDAYSQAKQFVSQLTLLEKVNITTGIGWESGPCVGNTGSVPRLGFNGFCNQDSPLGVRDTDYNSGFSSGQLVAATWDRSLMYQRGFAMGSEHKGKGVTIQLGPVAGPIGRAPEAGRNWEGFAPDPVLTGVGISETIRGIQDAGVIACAKHFIGNEQEHFRQVGEAAGYGFTISDSLSSNIDDQTLHELYLWPFADAVRAGVGAFMCSYNQVNNSHACQNSKLLNGVLKGELGFQGFVMSDWSAQHSGVSSALAGLDMTMPGDTGFNTGLSYWGANLTIAVLNGTVPEWKIDDMAMRVMAAYFKVGNQIDNQPRINFNSWTDEDFGPIHWFAGEGNQQLNWHVDVRGDHGNLIREIGAKGAVLLKNTGSLPLGKPKFIAVFGEDAGPATGGPNGCGDRGCDNGTLAMGWGSGTANFPYLITPDSAIQAQAINIGSRYESIFDNYNSANIETLASTPEATCIVFGNSDSGEGYINVDGNEGDRNNLTLWQNAETLIKNVSSLCPNTIVVMHTGGPVLVGDWYNSPNITAILWAGLPGEQSGNSLVDVLWGNVNPGGKSVFTWANTRGDYGTDVLYEPNNGNGPPQQTFTEGIYIDYRHFDQANIDPIYEFGFGLSYTTFEYSNLVVSKQNVKPYRPTTGQTKPAPSIGATPKPALGQYGFPEGWKYVTDFIYPYLNTTKSLKAASEDPHYGESGESYLPPGATDGAAQPLPAAGDATNPGGNAQLYDVLYEVTATITNTGKVTGDEVPQLYVSLGGSNPPVQLRGFDRLTIDPGQSATFQVDITRRDLSNWDVASQDWVVTRDPKKVFVGSSSRKLPLSADLN